MTNLVILTGRLARDPESRETKGGTSVTGITVVTDRPARDKDGKTYKDENGYTAKDSEFHRVTCFNGLSKTVGQFCTKGQLVSVQGRLHYTQWEDQEGVKRYGCEILADKVDFLSRGNARDGDGDNRDAPEIDLTALQTRGQHVGTDLRKISGREVSLQQVVEVHEEDIASFRGV